ncbi:hypothetical protein Tco_1028044 [Tanacetum coccineum]
MSLSLAENVIVTGADNLTIPGDENTPATVRVKTYKELTNQEKLHESVDIKATNIVLQGLPQDIYNLLDSGLAVPSFLLFDNPIASLNKTIQGRQNQWLTNTGGRSNASGVNRNGGCTKPKRPKNSAWFREKMLLTETLDSGATLDEE